MRDVADIFREQIAAGFPAFTGAHVAAVIPVSAAFLNELANQSLPPGAPVAGIEIEPQQDNAVRIGLRIARAPIIPPLTVTLLVDRQPQFPDSPVLVLRLVSSGLAVLARVVSRLFAILPDGVRLQDDRVLIDIAELLRQRGAANWLEHVQALEITTMPGAMLLSIKAAVARRET